MIFYDEIVIESLDFDDFDSAFLKELIGLLHCGSLTMPLDQLDIKSHRSNEAKCHAPIKTSSCSKKKMLNKNDQYP